MQSLVQRRRRELLLAAGITVLGYAGYRAWTSDTVASWRQALKRAGTALDTASSTLAAGTAVTADLLHDVKAYLESGEEEALPPRLRQLAALLQSEEVGGATASAVAALWAGIHEGAAAWQGREGDRGRAPRPILFLCARTRAAPRADGGLTVAERVAGALANRRPPTRSRPNNTPPPPPDCAPTQVRARRGPRLATPARRPGLTPWTACCRRC